LSSLTRHGDRDRVLGHRLDGGIAGDLALDAVLVAGVFGHPRGVPPLHSCDIQLRQAIDHNITMYWLTGTGASAPRSYWEAGRAQAWRRLAT
jgi:hypothetical protein